MPKLADIRLKKIKTNRWKTFLQVFHIGTIIFAVFFSLQASAQLKCAHLFDSKTQANEVTDMNSLGQAMTNGMQLNDHQADIFEIYRKTFFGDPTFFAKLSIEEIMKYLGEHPELQKDLFTEYTISTTEKIYTVPPSVEKFQKSQIITAAQIRNNLFQIEANAGFWKKLLDYHDPVMPAALTEMKQKIAQNSSAAQKEAYRQAKLQFESNLKKLFDDYLSRIISKSNRQLLADLKTDQIDYHNKAKALFSTLKTLNQWMTKRNKSTQIIRQSMVDLVHTIGFGNQATQALLKTDNALDRMSGLKNLFEEREIFAKALGYTNGFDQLLNDLKIEFPTGFSKNETPLKVIQKLENDVLKAPFILKPADVTRVRSLSTQEAPFRSCLGSDCSSRFDFWISFDPNYNYFTLTDSHHISSGQMTVVLGQAKDPVSGKVLKIAFVDKIQNVPNRKIENMLNAVSQTLAERGYLLALPTLVGNHDNLSNTDETRHFVDHEILPGLTQALKEFTPHPHAYSFPTEYSRAYKKPDIKIYTPKPLESNVTIERGQTTSTYQAKSHLDKNVLFQDFLKLKNSTKTEDIEKFIASGTLVESFENSGVYTRENFIHDLQKISGSMEYDFNLRKKAQFSLAFFLSSSEGLLNWLEPLPAAQRVQVMAEIETYRAAHQTEKKYLFNCFKSAKNLTKYFEIFKLAVQKSLVDINAKEYIFQAIENNDQTVIDFLIQQPQLKINASVGNVAPFDLAFRLGQMETIKKFLKMPNLRIKYGFPISITKDNFLMILLIARMPATYLKAKPLSEEPSRFRADGTRIPPHEHAVMINDANRKEQFFIDELSNIRGETINAQDPDGNTALMITLKYGKTELAQVLKDAGAN